MLAGLYSSYGSTVLDVKMLTQVTINQEPQFLSMELFGLSQIMVAIFQEVVS